MLRSLSARLLLFFLLPLVASSAIGLFLTVRTITNMRRASVADTLRAQAGPVATLYGQRETKLFANPDATLTLRDDIATLTKAQVFYVPAPDAELPLPEADIPTWRGLSLDWARISKAGATQTLEAVPPGARESALVVAAQVLLTPPKAKHRIRIGAIVLARPLSTLAPAPRGLARRLAPAFLTGAGVAVALALAVGIGLARPLRRLVHATGEIAQGSYDVRLDTRRRDEIGKLNRAFGVMAADLRRTKEHERLFLMRVSHELRTPLTAIEGHVGALADGVVEGEAERQAAYAVIASESARLERLIRDLLDLARLESRRFTLARVDLDLVELLERAALAHREEARSRDIRLSVDVEAAPRVVGDGDRILQVVSNLLANALRFTPAGGVIRLSAGASGGMARIEVADSGPGVPKSRRADVLRPFSTDGGGLGLGLAIASELALAMGGRLLVETAPEGGALFRCELPCRPVRAVTARPVVV
jgi:signal transduction histidine kinase